MPAAGQGETDGGRLSPCLPLMSSERDRHGCMRTWGLLPAVAPARLQEQPVVRIDLTLYAYLLMTRDKDFNLGICTCLYKHILCVTYLVRVNPIRTRLVDMTSR